jgi:hypothetical protein
LISSGVEALGTNYSGAGAYRGTNGEFSKNAFGNSSAFKAVMIASGGLSGGLSSAIAGGDFWKGVREGLITSGLNHAMHGVKDLIQKAEYSIIGLFGAGGTDTEGNADFGKFIRDQDGMLFTSLAGEADADIIQYITGEYNEGKLIKIYGYSRGAVAAVRIANELQHKVAIIELNLYDPVILGGELRLEGNHVMRVNHYYQRNPTDKSNILTGNYPTNPFKGTPLIYNESKYGFNTKINSTNYTGQYYKDGGLVNHNNIIKHILGL